jgi:hypothetical protein
VVPRRRCAAAAAALIWEKTGEHTRADREAGTWVYARGGAYAGALRILRVSNRTTNPQDPHPNAIELVDGRCRHGIWEDCESERGRRGGASLLTRRSAAERRPQGHRRVLGFGGRGRGRGRGREGGGRPVPIWFERSIWTLGSGLWRRSRTSLIDRLGWAASGHSVGPHRSWALYPFALIFKEK